MGRTRSTDLCLDAEFVRWVKENQEARRLTTIPGVGAIVASALVAAVGRAESFDRGRDLAAWLARLHQLVLIAAIFAASFERKPLLLLMRAAWKRL